MDRDGEEVVAIVDGLDAPGLTVTVSNRSRHNGDKRRPSGPRIHINSGNRSGVSPAGPAADHKVDKMPAAGVQAVSVTPRASVETATGAELTNLCKGFQICDDRYTSSYKVAHCQMTPTSPPEAVSEFPPQRREPCRNQGNFEIGGNGSAQWSFHTEQGSAQGFRQPSQSGPVRASPSRVRPNGGSQIWRDKGSSSSHRYCNTKRDPDAFEQSLRKYPNMGPYRSASHDLIERLIRYTQAKNFQEMSRSSKSVRSLRNQKAADTEDLQSKHQQTYTRRQENMAPNSSGVQVGHVGRTRNFKLYSPVSDSKNLRNRETAFSTSYDYLKAGSPPDGRSNRSDGSPSPAESKSPEDSRSPVRSPVRFGSPVGSKGPGSPGTSRRPEMPIRFEGSVRDLSLSEMSKYIRNTVRQICNEKPVVFQVCPKLKNRYNQHKKVCPSKCEQTSDLVEYEEDEAQASGSVLSRIIRSISGWSMPSTDAGCQCKRIDCYCTRATQCGYDSEVFTNTVGCNCRTRTIEAKTSCSRDLTCVCARKAQEQAYYNKKIDEAISEWLKDVPVHSIECVESKKKRETAIKELRQSLKQLPDDEDFDENVRNEISSFIDDFPLWNPGKDEEDEIRLKNQLTDKLIEKIVAIPRKPDRFREIVTKWVENLDFEADNEEIEMEVVIDDFVNKLKSLATERPACDMKYKHILRKEITQLLVELPLNYDTVMLKKKAHQLATEIVNLPRNIKLKGDTDSINVFEQNISEWICEHGLCRELKKDPKLIEGLANKLKSQGDEELIETMKELIFEFVDDVDTAIGILDEFVDELMKTVPSTVQKDNLYSTQSQRFDQDELHLVVNDWISSLPGASDFFKFPSKFDEINEDITAIVQGNLGIEDLEHIIFEYIVDTGLPIDLSVLHTYVDELMKRLNALPPSEDLIEQAKRNIIKEMFKIIDTLSMSEEKQEELKKTALNLVDRKLNMMTSLKFLEDQDDVKEALVTDMSRIIDRLLGESQDELKNNLTSSIRTTFDKSFIRLSKDESDWKQTIEKNVRKAVNELPVGTIRKEDLMGQVNKTLCKHMNKPLPPNIKNIINDDICNIFEKCPITEDRSLCGRLKKTLFDVVGQHLDMLLPKPVCDFKCEIEKDVSMVIDRCPIDPGNKKQLKKCVQDIFTKNGDCLLSEEVVRTIQKEIYCVCSDLPIPKDKKVILKKAVGASVSKNFNDALSSLSHDLIKLRKRLYDSMTNVIEKSPIKRDVKSNLKSQLKSTLNKNLDYSLSDEEMHKMLDEVSVILKDDMPEEKRKNLTNKLSNKMDTFKRKEKSVDLGEMITKDVDQLVNRLPIDSKEKEDVKNDIKVVLLDTLYNPLTEDKQHKIKEDIIHEIDEVDIPNNEKNDLKSNVAHAMTKELNELIAQGKEVPEIKTTLEETIGNEIKDSSISKDKQDLLDHKLHNVLADNLVRDVTNEEKEAAREKLTDIAHDLKIDKGKSEALKTQLLSNTDKYFEKSAQDRMQAKELPVTIDESISDSQRDYKIQNKILQGLENSIDDASIPEDKKIELKTKLKNIAAKNLKKPLFDDATELTRTELKELENKTKQNIVRGLENAVNEASLPKEKKIEVNKKLKDLTTQQFKSRLSDDVAVGLTDDMDDIIEEMNLPKDKKETLKSELTATVDDNMSDFRSKKKPSRKAVDDLKALDTETKVNIVRGLDNVIAEAPLLKENKIELKKQLKDVMTHQFQNRLSDDVAEGLKDNMDEIIEEMNLPKDKKDKLKSELTATVDDNMSGMQRKIKDADSNFPTTYTKALEKEIKVNIKRGLENAIDAAPIPKEKKIELMKKLNELMTQHFKNQLSDDVLVALKEDMNQIIDEMNLPRDKKDKLKSKLTATVDDNMSNYRSKTKPSQKEVEDSKALDQKTKVNIERGLDNVIAEAPLPKEKKIERKKQLKDLTTHQFQNRLSDDVAAGLNDNMVEIIDDMNLPKAKKVKLKSDLNATVVDNMSNMQRKIKDTDSNFPPTNSKALEKEIKVNIKRGLENAIDAAPIPKEKKIELMKKLNELMTQYSKNHSSDDVPVALKEDMNQIIDDMDLPRDKKDKLKSKLTATVDDNMSDFRSRTKPSQKGVEDSKALDKETKVNIERGLENVIAEAPLPKEKRNELKKQLQDLTTQQFKNRLSDDVAVGLKDNMDDIIDEMNLPKHNKNKLKSELTATVDDNMSDFRSRTKPSQKGVEDSKALDKETKVNIERGLENVIAEAPLPKEKRNELKKQLQDLTTQQFKNRLSDDVAVGLKDNMDDIIDEMNLPKHKKNKLKSELTATVDDNMSDFRSRTKPSQKGEEDSKALDKETKVNIERGLDNVIAEAPLTKEKKNELQKQLKDLTTQQFKSRLSDDVAVALKDDMDDIIDEMNLPKDKKDKLKSELTATVDDNMSGMQRKIKDADSNFPTKEFEKEIQANIIRELQDMVDAAPISKEQKIELMKKLKELTAQYLKNQVSDDFPVALKEDMKQIIDEMNLPKYKRDKLKSELTATVDDNMSDFRSRTKPNQKGVEDSKALDKETKVNIERGLENVIGEAPLPKEKKNELQKQLKDLTTQQFKSRLSDDVAESLKDDMDEIIDEMNLPKDKTDTLKSELTATVDDNMSDLRSRTKPSQKGVEDSKALDKETKVNIERGLENVIAEAPLPKEKKNELQKQLKDLTTQQFKSRLSDDVAVGLKDNMDEIIDEMNIPKHKKHKLKSELTATVDDNMGDFRSRTKPSQKGEEDSKALDKATKVNIERGLDNVIAEAPLPKEKKNELQKQLKDLTTQQFKSRLSDDVAEALKDDMDEIIDDMNLPKDKTDTLKSELTATVDDNMIDFRSRTKPSQKGEEDSKALDKETKVNIERGLDNVIAEAPLPKEKKNELQKQLKDLTTQQFKSRLSDDVAVGLKDNMDEIIDEMNIPKHKKHKLKSELTATVDDNMGDFRSRTKPSQKGEEDSKALDKATKVNIERGLDNVIAEAPLPKEKKNELQKQLKDLTTQQFKSRLSDDVAEALKDDMDEIIDDMNLPKDKTDSLKSELTATVDDNMIDFRSRTKPSQKGEEDSKALDKETKVNIERGLDNVIAEAPLPKEKKNELQKQLKDLTTQQFKSRLSDDVAVGLKDNMDEIIDEMNIPKRKKDKLKSELTATVDDNMSGMQRKIGDVDSNFPTTYSKALEKEIKLNIKRGLENAIDAAPIPKEKKIELKKKINELMSQYFKNQLSDDVPEALKEDINQIIDEISLPKDKKDKLKSELTATVDDNMSDFRSRTKPSQKGVEDSKALDKETKVNIERGLENVIAEAPLPKEKKNELQKQLTALTTQQFKSRLSDDVAEALKDDMNEIVDEMNLPKDKTNTLKSELTATVDENMGDFRSKTKPSHKGVEDSKALDKETKVNIERGLENVIAEAPLPKEKKNELQKQLKDLTTQQFKNRLSDDVAVGLKDNMDEIIDEMNIPKHKRDKLKSELTATVDDNMSGMQRKIRDADSNFPTTYTKALENEIKLNIKRGLENAIDAAPIPKEKKIELKKKINELMSQYFKNQLSDDVPVALKEDMNQIIDEMNLPKDKKDKLKSDLTATVDDNMSDFRSQTKPSENGVVDLKALDKETKVNIVRGLENAVNEVSLPKEKNTEVKKKLKDLTTQQFKSRLSDDVAVGLKDNMDEIIDEMNLPKHKKDKLKSDLTATVDDNMSDFRSKTKLSETGVVDLKALDKETKVNIERGLENVIAEAPLPKEKKNELQKQLKDLTTQQFKSRLSDDVTEALKDDMDEIIDKMNLPKDKKDTLKSELTATVDDNMSDLRSKTKSSRKAVDDLKALENETKENIVRGLENAVNEARLPKVKKLEVQKKLKDLTTQQFKNQLSDDVAVGLKDDMDKLIDEMHLPKEKSVKFKSDLTAAIDDSMTNFRSKTKPRQKGVNDLKALDKETKVNFERGLENVVNEAPLPKEKKIEVQKKPKDLTTQQFKNKLSDDVAVGLKDNMDEIMDEMNLPKSKKNKLKSELTATVDDDMNDMHRKNKDADSNFLKPKSKEFEKEIHANILRELQDMVDAAPMSKEKKIELMKKLKELTAQYLKNQVSDDFPEALKENMNQIIYEMNLQKDKKTQLKSELNATLDENMSDMQSKIIDSDSKYPQTKSQDLENEAKVNMIQGLVNVINEAPIPEEKKLELTKQVQDLSTKHFKKPLFENAVQTLQNDINEVIGELNIPKDKKDELKGELTATVDENMRILQRIVKDDDSKTKRRPGLLPIEETKKKDRILQGIEKVIEKSAIPENKKRKLSGALQKITADDLKKRLSFDVRDKSSTQLDDINDLKKKTESNILLGHEKAVDKAKIPKELRKYLKNRIKGLTKKHFMKPIIDNSAQEIKDDIHKEIDDQNLPEELKDQLKIELDEAVDENMRNLLKQLKDLKIKAGTTKDESLKDIFDKFGINPSDEDTLTEEFNKLLDIALRGGDLEDARRKLIKKLMRDLNLSEDEASALADDLSDKARKMALKEQTDDLSDKARKMGLKEQTDLFDKYGIDPSYKDKLAEEFNKLLDIARNGGDFEDARNELIKQLMRDLNLSEEEASDLADDLIDKSRKMALKEEQIKDLFDKYDIDPSYKDQLSEEFDKLLEIARKGGDFEDARNKLIKKIMRDLNLPEEEASALADDLIDKARKMALKEHLRDIFDKHGINPSDDDKFAEEFNKLLEIARKGGNLEDARRKLIKKLMRDLNLSEAEVSALADDLIARARELALTGKTTEAFSQVISDVIDQSTVAKADKPILKNKLLSKLKQILDKKPYIHEDDIGPLKLEVLKECNEIVDESSIPKDKKNELYKLLKEKLGKAFEEDKDGEVESLEDYNDKITKFIKQWMESLPIHLDPKVAATVADNIASDILDRHKYLHAHPEAKSKEKDEIENLKYQVFRRMHRVVNPKAIPKIMERTPDLYKTIMKIKPPPQEPKKLPKPKDAFTKKTLPQEEDPLAQKKMKALKKVFAKSVDQAIVESSLSKPDKSSIKKRLMDDLGITWADRKKADKYDAGPSDAIDKNPTALEYKKRIWECVKTWLKTLPIDIDPKTAATIADNLTNDILERQKYLRTNLKAVPTDEDEIENLMDQVFRRLKDIVDPEGIPDIMKRTTDLYNMVMNIKKELESQQEQCTFSTEPCPYSKRRRDPSPEDWKKSISAALSTGNRKDSLRKLIATTKGRKQWSKNSDDAITKTPSLEADENLNDLLALFDETSQIGTANSSIVEPGAYQGPISKRQFSPKPVPKNKGKSRLSKIGEALTFNNSAKHNSPFNVNKNQITEKDYEKVLNDFIKNWLDKANIEIAPKEKNEIVGKLVRDIVERQKYIQEYKIENVTRNDDLDYLKFQVHRRLYPLVPAGSLKTIVEGTGELTDKIENVQVPDMVTATNENDQIPDMVTATNENVETPQMVPPPETPPKSSIKSPVSKKKKTKPRRNSQTSSSSAATSTEEVQNNKKTIDDDALKHEMSNTEFNPTQASTPTKTTGDEHMDKVTECIRTWIESVPLNLEPNVQTETINDLANDIIDRQKFLQVHPEKMISKNEEIENLRFQVFKRLDKVTDDESLIPDIDKIEELYKMINGNGRRKNLTPKEAQEFQTTLPDEIAAVLNDYNICCERRELLSILTKELAKLGNSNADQDEIIENLIDAIKRITYLSNCDMCDDEAEDLAYKLLARTKKLITRIQQPKGAPVKRRDFRETIMNDIGDVFHGCPMSADKRRMMECQLAEDYAKDLGIPLEDSELTMTGAGHYGMSFNGLTNFIDTWLSSIHTEDDGTKDESEINDMKKNMGYNLIHKIGEMNVDPEIFNDDALYEAVLRDELQNMLGDITIPDEEINPLKEDLINKVLEAKQRAHDEFAGQAYKRHLRDAISKVLPDQRNIPKEEQDTMKILKDQLADAYIDLHFSGNNESHREKLKKKISNELNRFCRDYMNRIPCAPLNSQKLNQALYAALNAIPLPPKDSIRYEVEQARIREEINDWLKELPIQPQNPTELLARNKMIYVLAKKLFDIEIEGSDTDNDSKRAEIVKFLNRLPLETEEDLETVADTLIDKLSATEESRKYNASSNVTIDSFGNVSMDTPVCSKHKSLFEKRKASPGPSDSQMMCGRPIYRQPKPMPPCTLSPEDKDYLARIRQRTNLSPGCVRSIMSDNKPRTCPGARPIDTGCQTTQAPLGYQRPRSPTCRIADDRPLRPCSGQPANACSQQRRGHHCEPQRAPVGPCPGPSKPSPQCLRQLRKHTISSANISDGNEEVQPELTVKKCILNPNDKNGIEESEIPQNARCNRDPSLRHQLPCDKIRISSGAQCSPPPCGRPTSLSKLQQQNTGPQRVPFDSTCSAPSPDPISQRQPSSSHYDTVTQRSFQPSCAPSPCMSPFGLNNQSSPSSSPFLKRDNECRIPKRDGLDHQDQMPFSSNRTFRKDRVIELGSLDNLCNARPKKRHNDENDWHFEEEEEDSFWSSPTRRVILDEGIDDSVVMEREQREERIRCKCKERLVPKSHAGRAQPGNSSSQQYTQGNDVGQNLKKCAKCCGRHCPYPSYLYFRQ